MGYGGAGSKYNMWTHFIQTRHPRASVGWFGLGCDGVGGAGLGSWVLGGGDRLDGLGWEGEW
jgi:hypothetical protein